MTSTCPACARLLRSLAGAAEAALAAATFLAAGWCALAFLAVFSKRCITPWKRASVSGEEAAAAPIGDVDGNVSGGAVAARGVSGAAVVLRPAATTRVGAAFAAVS